MTATPPTVDDRPVVSPTGGGKPGRAGLLLAAALYLVLAIILWWNVWTGSPSGTMTCACTDAGRMVWYLDWVAYALRHGLNPLYSTWLFHPGGINLLDDTSVPALGVVLAPVTWLFGPVVSMNVAQTLLPALDALACFWLLRRWVDWSPAAWVGGLLFGFSAYLLTQLTYGWLNMTALFLFPVIVGLLDDLLVRQSRPAGRTGVLLGLVVVVQFFLSTEMLVVAALTSAASLVLLVGHAAIGHRRELTKRLHHAVCALGVAAGVAVVLLAYPLWFFLFGPAHLGTVVWTTNVPGAIGNTWGTFWHTLDTNVFLGHALRETFGGYLGPTGPHPSYLGPGILLVTAVAFALAPKDRRLWFFGALAVVAALLSLQVGGTGGLTWAPWALLDHWPLLTEVVQGRFSAVVDLSLAIIVALAVDQMHRWLQPRGEPWAKSASAALATVACGPLIIVMAPTLPFTVQSIYVPGWFTAEAPRLDPTDVLAPYPFPTADSQAAIPWQAITGLSYKMAGGGGPAGTVDRAGAEGQGFSVLHAASLALSPPPDPNAENLTAVRRAFRQWGVTEVVVPVGSDLPAYLTGRSTAYGLGFYTATMGTAPRFSPLGGGAWVWNHTSLAAPPHPTTAEALQACTTGVSTVRDLARVPSCVLAHPPAAS